MSLNSMQRVRVLANLGKVRKELHGETNPMKKVRFLSQIAELRKQLGIGIKVQENTVDIASHNEDPILEKYRVGAFNEQDADEFKATMEKVYQAGMPIDELASGVNNWFAFDKERLAA
ncbi:hypothetical protein [Photobacterium leiognathi]|uniref:hypothetical protein n=1 Tax=Photobacterium leiognathi TaxID=553611 RepID=UPI0029826F88|nr:hypothetical protein [Photobacterium leiognathi]